MCRARFLRSRFRWLLLIPTAFLSLAARAQTLEIDATYVIDSADGTFALGLTYDGSSLWISAQSGAQDRLKQYSVAGQLLQSLDISPRGGNPGGGLAFDGVYLYALNYGLSGFNTIDRFTTDAVFIDAVTASGIGYNTFGIVWNGSGFYQGNSPSVISPSTIFLLDADRQQVSSSVVSFYVSGLAWDGSNVWACDSINNKLLKLDANLQVLLEFDTPVSLKDITWASGGLMGPRTKRKSTSQVYLCT